MGGGAGFNMKVGGLLGTIQPEHRFISSSLNGVEKDLLTPEKG